MPPKKPSSSARGRGRGRGRGKKTSATSSNMSKPDSPADNPDLPANPEPDPHSRDSSVSSNVSVAASNKKRAKKNHGNMSIAEEEVMLEFIRDNPVLWNVKMTDYRRKDKKDKIWEDQANLMAKTADALKVWFRSLRDTHTRLDKKKSGDGAPELTEREEWVISNFTFLKTVTRHRPEPLQSVSIQLLFFFLTSLLDNSIINHFCINCCIHFAI